MNYYEHHIGDYAAATSHLSLIEDAVYSRMLRRYYLQEAPLPAEVTQVARLVSAHAEHEIEAVEAVLAEFFYLADDGWHQKRADADIARFQEKQGEKEEERANEADRKRRYRERRAELFGQLRDIGIVPAFDTATDELVRMLSRGTHAGQDGDGTATQSPVTSHQSPVKARADARPAKNRGTRLPPDWAPDPDLIVWARAERPELGLTREIEKFRDYWAAKAGAGGVKLDWPATFRNWVRNSKSETSHANSSTSHNLSVVERIEQNIRDRRENEPFYDQPFAQLDHGRDLDADGEPVRPCLGEPVRGQA